MNSAEQPATPAFAAGYRLTVVRQDTEARAVAETMPPLIELNEQFVRLGYEFIKLERI